MSEDPRQNIFHKIRKYLRPINIYNQLKALYFTLVPKGSKVYKFTHGFLSIFLKKIHLFNISYKEWIKHRDTLNEEDLQEFHKRIAMMDEKPNISIIMPVYNPPLKLLEEAIQSVMNQVYPYWELCIADDASTNKNVAALLKKYADLDPRIKVILREKNGHISAASNSALSLAKYDYMALLDHDDVLHPLALYYTAQMILEHPDSQIIYSDEDKITKRGRRLDAYFKPDFNYELLLSHNMVSHLGVYRTSTVREVGGFRVGLEGSQDYDLLLRVFEQVKPEQIHHIPYPLYHWRISRESAAEDINIKPYAIEAGIRALEEHLQRQSKKANVKFLPDLAGFKIDYDLPKDKPTVSILIRCLSISETLIKCINSILEKTDYPNFSIIVCLPEYEKSNFQLPNNHWQQKVKFLFFSDEIFEAFAKLHNQAIDVISSDFVIFMDKAILITEQAWLNDLVGQAIQEKIGAVAPKLLYQNDVVYSNGIVLFPDGLFRHLFRAEEQAVNGYFGWAKLARGYSALSEKCLLVDKTLFEAAGGFTTSLKTPIYTMIDFCLKLRSMGYRNILRPFVELYIQEFHNYNIKMEFSESHLEADRLFLKDHWENWVNKDPAFNPNIKIVDEGKLLVELSPDYQFPGVITNEAKS